MCHEDAVAELRRHAGRQFDPDVVEALVSELSPPVGAAPSLSA
jgi:response regulator RpfG family c-di-GMP phosphodiesterase